MFTKELLLNTNCVEDNEYLDKYLDIINKDIGHIKYKTQKHHIIPQGFYKRHPELTPINDTVNLYHKDHVLAHYYLALCSINEDFRWINELAFYYLTNKKYLDITEIELIKTLPEYQRLYEEMVFIRSAKNKDNILQMNKEKDVLSLN